jgi:hypothetical protein
VVLLRTAVGVESRRRASIQLQLEAKKLPPQRSTSGLRQSAAWAYEAADTGLLSPELVAGIRRVKGVPQIGRRVGNWLRDDRLADGTDGLKIHMRCSSRLSVSSTWTIVL